MQKQIYKPLYYLDGLAGFRGTLADDARTIVRAAEQRRSRATSVSAAIRTRRCLRWSSGCFLRARFTSRWKKFNWPTAWLRCSRFWAPNDASVKTALAGKSPEERAKEVIDGTKLDDVAVRKQLYEGGQQAVDASTDPLIVMMRTVEPDAVAVHMRNEDEVDSVLRKNAGTIAKIHFAQGGLSVPPDATFTLRLSYGAVKGYEENGKHIPWFTTMGGAYRACCRARQQATV